MPHIILKKVWDYCSYSKKYLAFIFILLFISSLIQNYIKTNGDDLQWLLVEIIVLISVSGYGMVITRSRINHGKRLPKIVVKDIISFGIKSTLIMFVYAYIREAALFLVSMPLNFPKFDLEKMILNWSDTIQMLFNHDPLHTILFIVFGSILFYVTTFFMEIALAKLADTKSLSSALNLKSIKKSIDVIGWRNYVKEYTLIVLSIVILSYLVSINIPFPFLDSIIDMFLSFLIFVTQYLGIGAIYCNIKDLESGYNQEQMPN